MKVKYALNTLVLSTLFIIGSVSATPVTINFDNLDTQNGSSSINVLDIAPELGGLSLNISTDTFDRVSFLPFGSRDTFSLNGDNSGVIDTNQTSSDQGLGARDAGDTDGDIDGFGDNDILLFDFSREVTLVSILFDNINDTFFSFFEPDSFVAFSANTTLGVNDSFTASNIDVPNIAGDDGLFILSSGGTGSFFGIGAISDFASFRIRSLTLDVSAIPVVNSPNSVSAVSAPASMMSLFVLLGGIVFLRHRKN